ncbi:MAG TPA: D-aminoacyl-tRNA deacylase [Candidatus Sulfopaludibacter sp.]|jgi:D-tyrosyl-tRNA(Tyr) deacylase|nr:D-aminoacyl-tRNA deacylase [Candidatus Sulfopaludibacter sp.]
MRIVIQRVTEATVVVEAGTCGSIRTGLVVFVGIAREDTASDAEYLSDRLLGLRIFPDENGKMNRNILDAGGSLLIVSQFTLHADVIKGRRPSFDRAAPAEQAKGLYEHFVEVLRRSPVRVETGIFQATMQVQLVNDGPVTILIDSADRGQK